MFACLDILEAARLPLAMFQAGCYQRQKRLAQERVDRLLREAESLQKAETIRTYIERVQTIASQQDYDRAAVDDWARWALDVANTLDPVLTGRFLNSAEQETQAHPTARK